MTDTNVRYCRFCGKEYTQEGDRTPAHDITITNDDGIKFKRPCESINHVLSSTKPSFLGK
ncbi:hypothetical protein HOF65_06350 [bacterium]|jgi:hypothetical protein|nr:hypothetical protein [bacterium]MBT3853549.1 hypothetical protein [bacterium]MBT4633692.1 hypothetical protein [bacterium]MBT5491177.1 hypothetical protein [bacterium]MBT6779040.1 hypothetical protein [bacterium]